MVQSILDIILIIAYVIGFVINPLHREKRNGFSLCIVGIMLLIFWVGLAAGVYAFIGVPLTLASINAAVAMANLPIWILVFVKKKITKPVWPKTDAVSLVIVVGFVLMCCVIQFGWKLNLTYGDVDPARYLNMAMSLIREQKVSGTYLTPLINAWSILLCKPFLIPVSYYRAFVLSDILMHVLSMAMFYILAAKINDDKAKLCNIIISILYFCGYQLYNLCYGAFFHWVDGILILIYLIYVIWQMKRAALSNLEGIICLILGVFGLLICYPFLLFIVIPILSPEIVILLYNILKRSNVYFRNLFFIVSMLVALIGVFFAAQYVGNSFETILRKVNVDGLAYREPYMDFLFFLPVFVSYICLQIRNKRKDLIILRINIVAIIFMGVWFLLAVKEIISLYYYYRMYYVLWLLAWLMISHVVSIVVNEKQYLFWISYAGVYIGLVFFSILEVDEQLYKINHGFYDNNQQYRRNFPLYTMNYNSMRSNKKNILTQHEFELCDFVLEKLRDEKVPAIYSTYSAMQSIWYQGISSIETYNPIYDTETESIRYWLERIQKDEVQYLLLFKSDPMYAKYKEEVFDELQVIYENEEGAIYTNGNKSWLEIIDMDEYLTEAEKALFWNAEYSIESQGTLLLCEQDLWQKAEYYTIYTGVESDEYWKLFDPDTFIPATYNLNINEVPCIVVLKDSEMYRKNQEYFDSQTIVYENDAGMILQHAGTGWMPSEQE